MSSHWHDPFRWNPWFSAWPVYKAEREPARTGSHIRLPLLVLLGYPGAATPAGAGLTDQERGIKRRADADHRSIFQQGES